MSKCENTACGAAMTAPVGQYIEMAKAFAAMSYQGVYLFDLENSRFVYSSDYQLSRCGVTEGEMKDKDLSYFIECIPEDEKALLDDIAHTIQTSYVDLPLEFKKQITIFLNFHILSGRRKVMVCHKLRMLDFGDSGYPRYLLGLVSPSVHDGKAFIMACIPGTDYSFQFTAESRAWESIAAVHLSNDELTMLRLTMQGHSLEEIGALMFKSPETIKFYRRQVFLKLNVKNISEAIAYATHYCLI